jgi:predicted phosphodiesterase
MRPEHRELCKHYVQRPKIYEQEFDALYDFICSNPKAMMKEVQNWYRSHYGIEFNTGSHRMLHDVRRVYHFTVLKMQEAEADSAIADLDHGEPSSLSWKTVNHKKMLVLSDIHFPYHDREALMIALREGKKQGVDSILLNGDILDFYQLSKFTKDNRKPSVKAEIDIFRFFVDQLKQRFPEADIYFKLGNHEARLDRWIKDNAGMFDGLFNIDRIINFGEHGIEFLPDNIGVKFGKLNIIHGHEIRAGMGVVNIARTYFMKTQTNVLFGHWHQNQEYITRTMDGHVQGAWAQGCLCRLDAEYTYGINQWCHGFSIVERLDDAGAFRVKLYKIIDGELV